LRGDLEKKAVRTLNDVLRAYRPEANVKPKRLREEVVYGIPSCSHAGPVA